MNDISLITNSHVFLQYEDGTFCSSNVVLMLDSSEVLNSEKIKRKKLKDNVSAVVSFIDNIIVPCEPEQYDEILNSLSTEQRLFYELNGNGKPGDDL